MPKASTNPNTKFLFQLSAIVSMLLHTTIITLRNIETDIRCHDFFRKNPPKLGELPYMHTAFPPWTIV